MHVGDLLKPKTTKDLLVFAETSGSQTFISNVGDLLKKNVQRISTHFQRDCAGRLENILRVRTIVPGLLERRSCGYCYICLVNTSVVGSFFRKADLDATHVFGLNDIGVKCVFGLNEKLTLMQIMCLDLMNSSPRCNACAWP